jgi:hypothetical protein
MPEYGGGPAGFSASIRPRQEGVRIPHPPFTEVARHSWPVLLAFSRNHLPVFKKT